MIFTLFINFNHYDVIVSRFQDRLMNELVHAYYYYKLAMYVPASILKHAYISLPICNIYIYTYMYTH